MGFLEKLFGKQREEVDIEPIEIQEWLQSKHDTFLKEEDNSIKKSLEKAREEKQHLLESLSALERAKLINPDIPDREKHIMEGNRANYIRKTLKFAESLDFPQPDSDYNALEKYANDFEKTLEVFNLETSKGYYILTHFFDNEMKAIASNIKAIEDNLNRIVGIIKGSRVSGYRELLAMARGYNELIILRERLEKEISLGENELASLSERKEMLENKIEKVKESPEFGEFKAFEIEKDKVDEEIKRLKNDLIGYFKHINKPLRKYMHTSLYKELISSYLEDPLTAAGKDKETIILEVLSSMKKELSKMELKEKQKEKFAKNIEKITGKMLSSAVEKHEELKKKKASLSQSLERSGVMMNFKELEYQLEHLISKKKMLETQISEKKTAKKSLNLEQKKENLEKAISKFTGYLFSIKDSNSSD